MPDISKDKKQREEMEQKMIQSPIV